MLLKSGADPNLPKEDGESPVHVAAVSGNLTALQLLLDSGGLPSMQSKVGYEVFGMTK